MKKLLVLTLSVLMLVSCFAFSALAEDTSVSTGETDAVANVNVAQGKSYSIEALSGAPVYYQGCEDDALTLLTDGNIPTYEAAGESVAYTGTHAKYTLTIELEYVYTDITAINFRTVCDSFGDGKSNRGFSGEKTKFFFSADGSSFEGNTAFTMDRVDIDDNTNNSFYDFCFKFDAPVTAKAVQILMDTAGGYVLSLGEVEVISTSGEGTIPEEPSEEESSEESSEESAEESSVAESEEESTEESADDSADDSADESANASTNDSKDDKKDDGKDGPNVLLIVGIIAAVVVVAVVVVVLMKKKDNKEV